MILQPKVSAHARNSWLIPARMTWIVFALTLTLLQVASQIASFRGIQNISLTLHQVQGLQAMGLSIEFYALWRFLLQIPSPLAWGGLGLLIFLRNSNERAPLILSAMMVCIGMASSIPSWKAFATAYPEWIWVVAPMAFIGNLCIDSFFFIFPTARYVPRWTVGVAIFLSAFNILNSYDFALPPYLIALGKNLEWFFPIFLLGSLLTAIGAPIYRYRRVSTLIEREQIKWVVATIAFAFVFFAVAASTVFIAPDANPDTDISISTVYVQPIGWVASLQLIPLSIGISILRYRLFDIDIIIRRTLIYSTITMVLALFYFGSVVVLQQVLREITGAQQSEIVTIISTLAIAALFTPLRRRVQEVIDHRFYRRKYDAQQVLARFARAARDEVELEKVTDELLNVVGETMQPTQVGLWLKHPEREIG